MCYLNRRVFSWYRTHTNTAFEIYLAINYANETESNDFRALLVDYVKRTFLPCVDVCAVAVQEPNDDDFLSPTFMVAAVVSLIIDPGAFSEWFERYLPSLPPKLTEPILDIDTNDSKYVHHVGLNLSRAWCLFVIARKFEGSNTLRSVLGESAERHLCEGLKHIKSDNYAGSHWLGTFALLALDEKDGICSEGYKCTIKNIERFLVQV